MADVSRYDGQVRMQAFKWARKVQGYGRYFDDFYSEGMIAAWRELKANPGSPDSHVMRRVVLRLRDLAATVMGRGKSKWVGSPRAVGRDVQLVPMLEGDDTSSVGDAGEMAYHRQEIREALQSLDQGAREALLLHSEGMSFSEIARAQGVSKSRAFQRTEEARSILAEKLGHLRGAA